MPKSSAEYREYMLLKAKKITMKNILKEKDQVVRNEKFKKWKVPRTHDRLIDWEEKSNDKRRKNSMHLCCELCYTCMVSHRNFNSGEGHLAIR